MPKIFSTKAALKLIIELRKRNIYLLAEYWDGHKHIDIFIPEAKLNIEVDGLQHFIRPSQILADFKRRYYSDKNGFQTIHIPNFLVMIHAKNVAKAIDEIIHSPVSKH